mmetsp:Transcript_16372/g.24003  ORF Transcript_16372/g.24003 Transcript_16372/m.24003 type:complete len:402 (+) Transcript_16372:99-1304(+)
MNDCDIIIDFEEISDKSNLLNDGGGSEAKPTALSAVAPFRSATIGSLSSFNDSEKHSSSNLWEGKKESNHSNLSPGLLSREQEQLDEEHAIVSTERSLPISNDRLVNCDLARNNTLIRFRPLRDVDKTEIKRLHEEWFPVRYKNSFYDSIVLNKTSGGEPLYSLVAVADEVDEQPENDDSTEEKTELVDNGNSNNPSCHIVGSSIEQQKDQHPNTNVHNENLTHHPQPLNPNHKKSQQKTQERIVGCVVGTFLNASNVPIEVTSLLIKSPSIHTKLFYIMTLGTITAYRQRGLGSVLIRKCCAMAERDKQCGVVYLHVITYNTAAIRFYERLGFVRVDEIEDYYTIGGEHYNCYLYAKYFNGNDGNNLSLLSFFSDIVSSIWNTMTMNIFSAFPSLRIGMT